MTEQEFLLQYDNDQYKKPSVTVDVVLLAKKDGQTHILLIKRGGHPYKNWWALPGGFTKEEETVMQSTLRELQEEASVQLEKIEQIGVYSMPKRDPRGWTIGIAYLAQINETIAVCANDDAKEAAWFCVDAKREKNACKIELKSKNIVLQNIVMPGGLGEDGYAILQSDLAFDHAKMIVAGLAKAGDL